MTERVPERGRYAAAQRPRGHVYGFRHPPKQLLNALAGTAYKGPHQYAVTFGAQNFREPVNHLIRMYFARGTEVLDEAIRRLEKLSALLA